MKLAETFLDSDDTVICETDLGAIMLGATQDEEHVTFVVLIDEGKRRLDVSLRADELRALLMRAQGSEAEPRIARGRGRARAGM